MRHSNLVYHLANRSYVSSMENWVFCLNQSKSPRPITWVRCHVIEAWKFDAERHSFHGNQACYHGNRHRFHGYLGLNGNHANQGWSQDGETPHPTPPREGKRGRSRLQYSIAMYCYSALARLALRESEKFYKSTVANRFFQFSEIYSIMGNRKLHIKWLISP